MSVGTAPTGLMSHETPAYRAAQALMAAQADPALIADLLVIADFSAALVNEMVEMGSGEGWPRGHHMLRVHGVGTGVNAASALPAG